MPAITTIGSTTTFGGGAVTTVTNNVPTGSTTNDLLVWRVSGSQITLPPAPSGWTEVKIVSSPGLNMSVWYRWATSTEPASYSVTVTTGRWTGTMTTLRSVDLTTPLDVDATSSVAASSFNPPSITPVTAGCMLAAYVHVSTPDATDPTLSSTNMTLRAQVYSTGATVPQAKGASFSLLQGTAVAFTPTVASSAAPYKNAVIVAAFRPATPGSTTTPVTPATRATTWKVLSPRTNTRATTWNVGSIVPVTATRATTWKVRKLVTQSRLTTWSVAAGPAPDVAPGAWALTPMRVRSISITGPGQVEGHIVLGAVNEELLVKLVKRTNRLTHGAVGGSPAEPPPDDTPGATPLAPTGLVLSSSTYTLPTGQVLGQVSIGWAAVTLDTFGFPIEVSTYVVSHRMAGETWRELTRVAGSDLSVSWSPYQPGETWQFRVRAVASNGNESAWSGSSSVLIASDSTAPPTPSTPVLSTRLGVITVDWDGLSSTGGGMPADFHHVSVYRAINSNQLGAEWDQLYGVGQVHVTGQGYEATRYFRFVAYDNSGNASAQSAQASIATQQANGPDIAAGAITADSIDAGAIDGMVITGAVIRTASTYPRTEMDATGFRFRKTSSLTPFSTDGGLVSLRGEFTIDTTYTGLGQRLTLTAAGVKLYDAASNITFNANAATGALSIKGAFSLDTTYTGSGARMLIDSTGLKLYNTAGDVEVSLTVNNAEITGNVKSLSDNSAAGGFTNVSRFGRFSPAGVAFSWEATQINSGTLPGIKLDADTRELVIRGPRYYTAGADPGGAGSAIILSPYAQHSGEVSADRTIQMNTGTVVISADMTVSNAADFAGVVTITAVTHMRGLNHGVGGGNLGFFGTSAIGQKTVTGSRAGNAALADLLTDLAAYGLIVDSTTA